MHPYQRPSETSYVTLGMTAVRAALTDAQIEWNNVDSAFVGTSRIGMAAGPTMLRYLGETGLPIVQIENASASGSSAFAAAVKDVAAGFSEVSAAIGVDKADRFSSSVPKAKLPSLLEHSLSFAARFALIADEYMSATGASREDIARVALKNSRNAAANPFAQRRTARTMDEILAPPYIAGFFTRHQCTPIGEGGSAVLVVSEEAMARLGIARERAVRVLASETRSSAGGIEVEGDASLTARTAQAAYNAASIDPQDLDIVEVHDAFTIEELIYAEALALCKPGEAARAIELGEFDIGGRTALNASGGLLGMGHPIGPTGVGQVAEIVRQLRGEANSRQHPSARLALAQMMGVGPICVIHVLERK